MRLLKRILKGFIAILLLAAFSIVLVMLLDSRGTRFLKVTSNPDSEATSYIIKNVAVIPMTTDTILHNKSVFINKGIIEAIRDEISNPTVPVIDGSAKYLTPGLTDMHVHVWDEYELGLYLANGVTTIRNLWGRKEHLKMKQRIEREQLLSPLFFTSGPKLTGPEFIGDDNYQLNTTDEARNMVIEIKENGYDLIKTYYGLPEELFATILDQAEKSGLDIAAHPTPLVPYSNHFTKQITSIEHAEDIVQQPLNYQLDSVTLQEIVTLFAKHPSTALCPTITVYHNIYEMLTNDAILTSEKMNFINPMIRLFDSEAQFNRWKNTKATDASITEKIEAQHNFHLYALRLINEQGGTIICGTDAGIGVTEPGASIHEELAFYKKAGLSNYEVLATATKNTATIHNFLKTTGTIEEGSIANVLLLDTNPLENLDALKHPSTVFIKGHKIERSTLDMFEEKAATRNNVLASLVRHASYLLWERP